MLVAKNMKPMPTNIIARKQNNLMLRKMAVLRVGLFLSFTLFTSLHREWGVKYLNLPVLLPAGNLVTIFGVIQKNLGTQRFKYPDCVTLSE